MGNYLRPDVYVERTGSGATPISGVGTATAGFVGIANRGIVGKAELVTSWTEFVSKFARGLETPFVKNSDLAYAVYGYFQNGGGTAYVVRTATESAKSATGEIGVDGVEVTAYDEGEWANTKLKVSVVEDGGLFDIVVSYDGEIVEVFEGLNNDADDVQFYADIVNGGSKFIKVGIGTLAEGEVTLAGGIDGITGLEDTDYLGEKGLKGLDFVNEVSIVAVPGQTSQAVLQGVLDYASNRKDCFGILDLPMNIDTEGAKLAKETLGGNSDKETLGGNYGASYYPWGKVVDPLGKGKLRLTPPSGHIAGIYARTDRERGVHKAPAGIEATVKGFVEMERPLSNGDIEILNPLGVNCIVAKPNKGIVVWGARLVTPHMDRTYVSDMRLDIHIEESLFEGTQWTIFEPNDEKLWGSITAQVKAFLYGKWSDGALFGETPEEAYFVKCDAELNPQEIRDAGKVIVEVGYAKKKPAEFTIFRLTQKTVGK